MKTTTINKLFELITRVIFRKLHSILKIIEAINEKQVKANNAKTILLAVSYAYRLVFFLQRRSQKHAHRP